MKKLLCIALMVVLAGCHGGLTEPRDPCGNIDIILTSPADSLLTVTIECVTVGPEG